MKYLNDINSPADLKKLTIAELPDLAAEVRTVLLKKLSESGGHAGPNLGIVETTVALHYVFDSPKDKIVFDVSHQSYAHKILTGRKDAYMDPAKYHTVSGFTNPRESEHDIFKVGHTATSVSLACGLAKARDLTGKSGNVIAVIGDGSLSGGEAFEGLDNAATFTTNLIIVVNDNDMSIAENHGGLYADLRKLRESNGTYQPNYFEALGFEYHYVSNGHDLTALVQTFKAIKDIDHPVVIHVHTIKGKGFIPAETDREAWHASGPFDLQTGKRPEGSKDPTYLSVTLDYLTQKVKNDRRVVAVTAATPGAAGLKPAFRALAGDQYVDVGIAEEHAVAFISGLARNGAKPVFVVFSSFLQRTYDQLSQDLCLNENPAVILVYGGGIGDRDATHLGLFDIPLVANIPNMVYMAPIDKSEYLAMIEWAIKQNDHPVAIRIPAGNLVDNGTAMVSDFNELNRFCLMEKGQTVALIGAGDFYQLAKQVKTELKKHNIDATLINPRFLTGIDKAMLETLKVDHEVVVTLENGTLDGGFGEKITRYYGPSSMKVLNYGAFKEFTDRIPVDTLMDRFRLRPQLITDDIIKLIN